MGYASLRVAHFVFANRDLSISAIVYRIDNGL